MAEYLQTQYEIIPETDMVLLKSQYVGHGDKRLNTVLDDMQSVYEGIEEITEENSRLISVNTTNIATNTSDISTLKTKVATLEGGIRLKGRVDNVSLLPSTAEIGDLYLVGLTTDPDLSEYLYTTTGHWELLGKVGEVDLSDYAKKTDIPKDYIRNGSQTSTSTSDGGTNIYTFAYADGTTSTFTVKNGTKGSTGAQGPQGEKGDTGATGPQGPKGETGATGSTGPQGPKGDTGAAGSNGTSCTHSWNGTTLTVTSASGTSSANLKGEKGDKGDTGSTGPKGDTGPQGPAGQNATTTAVATTSANGLMSTDHVTKLNGIAAGATAVSESTVSGWGFTKNSGTYSKPSTGIPKSDLASAVQTSLGKADTALQSHQDISGKLSKTGDTITGNTSLKESANLLLRPNNTSYSAGICYDTKGNECISLWAKNSVTRLRWNAGTDMTTMSSGKMMDITPDFEISKADGTAKGYIAGSQIAVKSDIPTTLPASDVQAYAKTGSGITVDVSVPANAKFTDTTYSSKSAVSGGTDVSLVTTGEKYTWNNKTSNTGTVTSVVVKMNGSTKGTVTSSGTIDLGTVITSHQSLDGKQDVILKSKSNIKTGSSGKQKISFETLFAWLISQGIITSNTYCERTFRSNWDYANNDVLQITANGINYEIHLAGCEITFVGTATAYNLGEFVLTLKSATTSSFDKTSGYTNGYNSTFEYRCLDSSGSSYGANWQKLITSASMSFVNITLASSSGFSSVASFPDGFNAKNCVAIPNFDQSSTVRRCGLGITDGNFRRQFVHMDGSGIKIYNEDSGYYSKNVVVLLIRS